MGTTKSDCVAPEGLGIPVALGLLGLGARYGQRKGRRWDWGLPKNLAHPPDLKLQSRFGAYAQSVPSIFQLAPSHGFQ
jgi:hypothetical protein